jgi:beta-phosphoglucomutase-like phosphatase (HAD superfamily)
MSCGRLSHRCLNFLPVYCYYTYKVIIDDYRLLIIASPFDSNITLSIIIIHKMGQEAALQPLRQIKAFLFDLDGTLLDTEALSDRAILQVYTARNLISHSLMVGADDHDGRLPWELKKQILGLRGSDWGPIVIQYAIEKWNVVENASMTVSELWSEWEQKLDDLCEQVEPCPGAVELVDLLYKTGLPMAIATSSRLAQVAKKGKRHSATITSKMSAIVAGDHPAVLHGKPAPDIYLEASRQLNVQPSECIVFEDALSGVRAGKAAGCYVVAVPDARFSVAEKEVFVSEADLVLDSLADFNVGSIRCCDFGISLSKT